MIWKVASDYGDGWLLSSRYRTEGAARHSLLPTEWKEERRALIDPTGRTIAVVHADGRAEGDLTDVYRAVVREGRILGWCVADAGAWTFAPTPRRPTRAHLPRRQGPEPPGL